MPMDTELTSTALTQRTISNGGASREVCVFQYCSARQLAAQTINCGNAGVSYCLMRGKEAASGNNTYAACVLYVVSSDGNTVRGTCWDDTIGYADYEMTTTLRALWFADADNSVSVDAQDGDYLIFEIGFSTNASATTGNIILDHGDPSSDFLDAYEDTGAEVPYLYISPTLTWKSSGVPNQLMMTGCGL